ncbi:MAG: hypothetical protein ACUVSK_11665, partial [Desulfotomaculales bacterium]
PENGVVNVSATRNGTRPKFAAYPERLFVVGEDEEQLLAVAPAVRMPARYTTDRDLLREPLERAFYRVVDGRLEREVLPFLGEVRSEG